MRKFKNVALFVLASVSEVVVALGASLLASVGPLSQVNSGILKSRWRPQVGLREAQRHSYTLSIIKVSHGTTR